MNIQILIHSKTGNTRKFADSISGCLTQSGHNVMITELATKQPMDKIQPGGSVSCEIINLPDLSTADLVMFGGPVWAFRPSPVIMTAIAQCSDLNGKYVVPFLSMGFPFRWMSGNSSLSKMALALRNRGAKVVMGGICRQMMNKLDADIAEQSLSIANKINKL